MGWRQSFRIGFTLGAIALCQGNSAAIAQWLEEDFSSSPMLPNVPLPTISEPIPAKYIHLGHQLETLQNRWQSTALTNQALQGTAAVAPKVNSSGDAQTQNILTKLQRHIDTYYFFLELREFRLAEMEAAAIAKFVGEAYEQSPPAAETEIRAMWVDRGAIVNAKNEAGLANLFDRLATMGINVVFLETVNASYPIFPSEVAPAQNPLLEGWDALASGVKLAHERGMELHAWTWIFAAANQRHNELMGQPQYYLGPVLTKHPDWVAGDRRGDPFHARSRKAFFDPANPEVQNYLLELLTEIATKYDVDGIQFDYIRYPFQESSRNEVYGFGDVARTQFRLSGGYPDPITLEIGDRHWRQWQDFRVAQVDQFVEKATTSLRQTRPDLTLSAAVFPIPRDRRLEQIQQNWEAWVEAEYLDLLVPMTYAGDTATLEDLTTDLLASFPSKSTLLIPSIRLLDLDSGIALDQRQHLRQLPTTGSAFFAASNLNPQLVTGLQTETSLLPHREPLAAIASRFSTLQREWGMTFAEQPWQNAARRFEERLATAQTQPSPKAILLAQSQWEEFRLTLDPQLETYAKQNSYQAQVWQYRLAVIEDLLRYGDRRNSHLP